MIESLIFASLARQLAAQSSTAFPLCKYTVYESLLVVGVQIMMESLIFASLARQLAAQSSTAFPLCKYSIQYMNHC
jgi:ribosomal protein S3AE